MSNEVKVALITSAGGILAALIAVFARSPAEPKSVPGPSSTQAVPTAAPTAAPAVVPTAAPTAAPRAVPTPAPTAAPTLPPPPVTAAVAPPATAETPAPTSPRSSSVRMAGSYGLHWTNLGTISGGQMDIVEIGPDDFGFKSRITGMVGAMPFQYAYQGTIKKIAGSWYVEITATNDPAIGRGAVRNDVSYDGSLLTFRADTGLAMAWRK